MAGILEGRDRKWTGPSLVSDIFEETVRAHANNDAAIFDDNTFSYKKLDEDSNKFARNLRNQLKYDIRLSTDDDLKCAGVFMSPSYDRLVTILALLKLNIAYVPLDPVIPANRLKLILREAKPLCIISTESLYDQVMTSDMLVEGHAIYQYEALSKIENNTGNLSSEEKLPPSPNQLFCILYTSGSTGTPKGVRLTHKNVINRLNWQWNEVPFQKGDVGCAKTSLLFVDSITEIFGSLLRGVPIVIIPKSTVQNPELFLSVLEKNNVTHLILVPSLLKTIFTYMTIDTSISLSKLRYVVSSGETLPTDLAKSFFDVFPSNVILANYYGSTEITGDVTFQLLKNKDDVDKASFDGKLSIGAPVDNNTIYIVDDDMKVTDDVGELLVSGLNVADGYMDTKNMVNFVKNHLNDSEGHEYLYRTGDYARVVNGMVIYEGRKDSQVKIRGQRVNMAEIERAVSKCNGVEKVVVLLCKLGEENDVIVAFCKIPNGTGAKTIYDACKKSLPDYMLPEIMLLDEFPLQPATGKIDRVGLRELFLKDRNPGDDQAEIGDSVTNAIMKTVSGIIGVAKSKLDLGANFFDLGGNSLNAINVIAKLKTDHGISVNLDQLLVAESLRSFITSVKSASREKTVDSKAFKKYRILPLTEVLDKKEEIIQTFGETYTRRDSLCTSAGVNSKEFQGYLELFWPFFLTSGASCICLDAKTSKVLGSSLVAVGAIDVTIPPSSGMDIFGFLEYVESLGAEKITSNFADSFLVGTCMGLTPQENLDITFQVENRTIEMAKEKGYDGIVTCNVSPVTRNMAIAYFGYETLAEVTIWNYKTEDGRLPFAKAPKDARVFLQAKYFTR